MDHRPVAVVVQARRGRGPSSTRRRPRRCTPGVACQRVDAGRRPSGRPLISVGSPSEAGKVTAAGVDPDDVADIQLRRRDRGCRRPSAGGRRRRRRSATTSPPSQTGTPSNSSTQASSVSSTDQRRRPGRRSSTLSTATARWSRVDDGQQRRSGRRPRHPGEVGVALPIPADLAPLAVEPDQPQRDVGVGRARRGIPDRGRLPIRVRRISDPPLPRPAPRRPARRATTTPSGAHQNPRIRAISSAATNSARPHDTVSAASLGEDAVVGAVGADDPKVAAVDVGDVPAGGVGAGVEASGRRAERADLAGVDVDHLQPATDRERRDLPRVVGRVRDDAGRAFADPLAAHPLGRRKRRVGGRVDDGPLGALSMSPSGRSSTHSPVRASSPAAARRNRTRRPSAQTEIVRGSPRVNRWVRARSRGKLSLAVTAARLGGRHCRPRPRDSAYRSRRDLTRGSTGAAPPAARRSARRRGVA